MQMMTLTGSGAHARSAPRAPQAPAAPDAPPAFETPDAATLRMLAYRAVELGRIDDARVVLERARELHPRDAEFAADFAAIELRAGHADAAIAHAEQALSLRPDHAAAALTRAFALSSSGRLDEARTQLLALDSGEAAQRLRDEQPELAELVARELARIGASGAAGDAPPSSSIGLATAADAPAPRPAAEPASRPSDASALARFPLAARFDVLVKYLYALQRLGRLPAWATCDPAEMYARHIQLRTGGVEPGDPRGKPDLASYVAQFDALIDSMAANGFDAARPIPLSSRNGLPCDGAHRCAAALALGIEPAFETRDAPGYDWGLGWFQRHGVGAEECNMLLRAWAQLQGERVHVAVLWAPAESAWSAIDAELAKDATIVGARTVELPRAGFDELVRDVYAIDGGPVPCPAIENKIRLLATHPARCRVVFLERDASPAAAEAAKRRVREAFDAVVPAAWFVTLHLSASSQEAGHLLSIFASETNLAMLRKRRALDPAMARMLAGAQHALAAHGLASADCVVVGGSVPGVLGLRPSDDLDVTLRRAQRHAKFDAGIHALGPRLDLVTEGYARSFSSLPPPSDDLLVDNPALHFRVRGWRFAHPSVVLARKQHQRREKDLRDLPLLAEFIDRGVA
jgi:hypothetical protein